MSLINISDVRSTSDTQLFLPVYCSVELWPQSGLIAVQCLIWLSSAKISFSVGRENYEAPKYLNLVMLNAVAVIMFKSSFNCCFYCLVVENE